jgi:hypothetical protein
LASQIGAAIGKNCAVVLVQPAKDDYAHVAGDQIVDDAVKVSPGYKSNSLIQRTNAGKLICKQSPIQLGRLEQRR